MRTNRGCGYFQPRLPQGGYRPGRRITRRVRRLVTREGAYGRAKVIRLTLSRQLGGLDRCKAWARVGFRARLVQRRGPGCLRSLAPCVLRVSSEALPYLDQLVEVGKVSDHRQLGLRHVGLDVGWPHHPVGDDWIPSG